MTSPLDGQRRGRRIAMGESELRSFLTSERTCRLATTTSDGPHLTALWFVWDSTALWLYSLTKSKRWTDVAADGRVAVLVDAGDTYDSLRGAELRGVAKPVGDLPRTGAHVPELEPPEHLFASKYFGSDTMVYDGRHAWLRLVPDQIRSWDFRKL
jgi:hypothetical protein